MKSKLTLSIQKETIAKAKELAKKRNSTVSQMVEEYFERTSKIEEKLQAIENISGIVEADLAAEQGDQYSKEIIKKHGWE
ncbi:MAG: antitoxin [Bacteroidetes bacterium]|jgi:Asp-tRNA(Asn)/Glu-tRNA(Gln) amidotransferase A subunit family amidase|nr:antitoxin [Bacteroidota bacterium]